MPLVFLHLRRARPPKLKVASTLFWETPKTKPKKSPYRYSIANTYSLVIHLAILVLLVFAAADWHLNHNPLAISVVLDNSPSMRLRMNNGKSRLEVSLHSAKKSIRSLSDSSKVNLWISGYGPYPYLFESSPTTIADLLDQWQLTTDTTDPNYSLISAIKWLERSPLLNRKLIYIGDGALSDWPSFPENITIERIIYNDPTYNIAILHFHAERSKENPHQVRAFISLGVLGQIPYSSIKWSLYLNETPIKKGTLDLSGQSTSLLRFTFNNKTQGGALSFKISADDACQEDNQVSTTLAPYSRIKVGYICREKNKYISAALHSLKGIDIFSYDMQSNKTDVDVLIVENNHVNTLSRGIPTLQFQYAKDETNSTKRSNTLTFWDPNHPLFEGVDIASLNFGNIKPLIKKPKETTLVRSTYGELIVINDSNGERYIRVGLNLLNTNFPKRPDFPTFISHAIDWLAESQNYSVSEKGTFESMDPIRPLTPFKDIYTPTVTTNTPSLPLPTWNLLLLFALSLLTLDFLSNPKTDQKQ